MPRIIIYDLDGTLLDTLGDLRRSVNYALRKMGWKERTLEEVRGFVGNGVHKLIERSVPEGTPKEDMERCFSYFQEHYLVHCQDTTDLYPGVREMLEEVHARGILTAIVSNKLQAGVDELYDRFFHDVVDIAIGQREGVPLKPAPDMVNLALSELEQIANHNSQCTYSSSPRGGKEGVFYVGDSEVDIETARRAGLTCIAVLWGFRDREQLVQAGATNFISRPEELIGSCNLSGR